MVRISKLLCFSFISSFALVIAAPSVPRDEICDKDSCYPVEFVPTEDWQLIKEGQQLPQGLDIRLDWQTGEKFAKLADPSEKQDTSNAMVLHEVESDNNKVVSYSSEDYEEDNDIQKLKLAASSSSTVVDLEDALELLGEYNKNGVVDEKKLIAALDSLTEHSHNLKDGTVITHSDYFDSLLNFATSPKYSAEIRELSLRVIAQALRHNSEALANIEVKPVLSKLFTELKTEGNSVIQKRILGVISSLIQTQENAQAFNDLNGDKILVNSFNKLDQSSKVRALQILDDSESKRLTKRSNEEQESLDSELFNIIQSNLANGSINDDHSLEALFDRLVALKTDHKSYKVNSDFLNWLVDHVHERKLNKRDSEEDSELTKKLLEARHLVFGNPNALRKALADEL